MTDNHNDDNGDRGRRGSPGDRNPPRGDKPFPQREGGDRPFRARRDEGSAGGDRPLRKPRPAGDRPFGKPRRDDGDRPRPRFDRPAGDRPWADRPRSERPRRDRDEASPRRPREEPAVEASQEPAEERIAKVIARAGVASRRDAEVLISEGRVTLDGEVVASPALNVLPSAKITVDGEPLPARERTRLWIFHKPRGLVTTARDPEGRPTVFESLPEDMPRVVAVGRLDINTEGLLLLTNDGGLARVIAHPDTGWLRRYKVRAHGEVTQERLDELRRGITIDGIEYGPIEANLDRIQGDNVWLTMGLREGKNREIKVILDHLGLNVNRLIRLSFGPFQLGDMEQGLVEEVRTRVLKDQLGTTLAAEANVDFESPVREPIAPFGSPKAQDRAERPRRDSRSDRDERPRERFGRDDRHGDRHERPGRDHGHGGPRSDRHGRDEERPARPRPGERRPAVWRDDAEAPRKGTKAPRRGADPKAARAASAERPRQRAAAIADPDGRKIRVERVVSEPRPETERTERAPRPPRDAGDRPPRRDFGDRPPRREGAGGDRPPRRDFGDRPPRREAGGERPFRAPRDESRPRPFRGGGGDEAPRGRPGGRSGGPRSDAPRGGSFGKGPREGGPKGFGGRSDGPRRAGSGGPRGPGKAPGGAGPRSGGPKGPRRGPPRDRS